MMRFGPFKVCVRDQIETNKSVFISQSSTVPMLAVF